MRIYIINGPNLNLLGVREPEIYGHASLADIEKSCREKATTLALSIDFFQSNHEGVLLDLIQEACEKASGLLVNFAAYSHSSIALLDALKIFKGPIVEVHLSNIYRREDFRAHSYSACAADAVFSGAGDLGYLYGLDFLAKRLKMYTKKL